MARARRRWAGKPLRRPWTSLNVAKLAGLLEGEGSFFMTNARRGRYPGVSVAMTDEDVIRWAADMWGTAVWSRENTRGLGYRPLFGTYVSGSKAIGTMMTLYPFLGRRRREKIRSVIKQWREAPDLKYRPGTVMVAHVG